MTDIHHTKKHPCSEFGHASLFTPLDCSKPDIKEAFQDEKSSHFFLTNFFYAGIVHAEPEIAIAKKQAIDKFMEATETAKNIKLGLPLFFHEIFTTWKIAHSSFGAKDADEIEKTLLEQMTSWIDGPDRFVTRSYAIYDKYFSLEEIEEMTNFYSTSVGKKI